MDQYVQETPSHQSLDSPIQESKSSHFTPNPTNKTSSPINTALSSFIQTLPGLIKEVRSIKRENSVGIEKQQQNTQFFWLHTLFFGIPGFLLFFGSGHCSSQLSYIFGFGERGDHVHLLRNSGCLFLLLSALNLYSNHSYEKSICHFTRVINAFFIVYELTEAFYYHYLHPGLSLCLFILWIYCMFNTNTNNPNKTK